MKRAVVWFVIVLVLCFPLPALASVGVGVGTGKIEVNEELRSGGIYKLPAVVVFNTGTEAATFSMSVTLNETQPQLKPDPKWFSFSPSKFTLEPGGSQSVTPTVTLPLVTKPGDYFGYLEARPDKTVQKGTAAIGVAAAAKLSFKVVASNVFVALMFRLLNLVQNYAPWSYLLIAAFLAALTAKLVKRYLKINIKVTRKYSKTKKRKQK